MEAHRTTSGRRRPQVNSGYLCCGVGGTFQYFFTFVMLCLYSMMHTTNKSGVMTEKHALWLSRNDKHKTAHRVWPQSHKNKENMFSAWAEAWGRDEKETFFFGGTGVWTQGFTFVKQVLCPLSATSPVHFSLVILKMGGGGFLMNYLPRLASNLNPPNLSLSSS
jgi:hypothetical protein